MEASVKKTILIVIASCAGLLLLLALGWLLYFKLQFGLYQDDQYKFSIKYPKSWKVVVNPQPNVAVSFIRPKDTSLDTFQDNVNVTVQPVSEDDSTVAAFGSRIKAQMTAVFGNNVDFLEEKPIHWDWRQGQEIVMELKVNHLKMINVWVLRLSEVYIFTFMGQDSTYGQDALIVNEMIHSLHLQ